MSAALTITNPVRVVLLAPACGPVVAMAAAVLARHLDMTTESALARLQRAPGSLATGLPSDRADRLVALLSVLGLRVCAEAETAVPRAKPRPDLSLQASPDANLTALARILSGTLQRPASGIEQDLQHPGGVILRGPDEDQVDRLRKALRRLKGVQLSSCCPDAAEIDLFSRPGHLPDRQMLGHLAVLGLKPCRFNGALASGLSRKMMEHVMARFGKRVFGLERAFQRLDLYLTGPGTMAPMDLADFLATRHLGGGRVDTISLVAPLRIETGLSYLAARQFQTDYEMIGLSTVARLTQPGRPAENS